MVRIKIIFSIALFFILMGCAAQKKVLFFTQPIPPQVYTSEASQEFLDHPPLYTPVGKRETIAVYSPHFTLAVPNTMDMTGKSGDLQKSLSDILYTEIFNYSKGKRRIDLLDRGALVNLDTKIILDSLDNKKIEPNNQKENNELKISKEGEMKKNTSLIFDSTFPEKIYNESVIVRGDTAGLKEYLKNADGILLLYITSRVGTEKGHFEIDYRIVINKGFQEKIVLLAGSAKIKYRANTERQIEYVRGDLKQIVENIYDNMTLELGDVNTNTKKKIYNANKKLIAEKDDTIPIDIQIIKCDSPFIVINIGKNNKLMPGMIGYVIESDDLSYEDNNIDSHYSYIAEFLVTDVFDTTSNAILIPFKPSQQSWDVRVDDIVVIK